YGRSGENREESWDREVDVDGLQGKCEGFKDVREHWLSGRRVQPGTAEAAEWDGEGAKICDSLERFADECVMVGRDCGFSTNHFDSIHEVGVIASRDRASIWSLYRMEWLYLLAVLQLICQVAKFYI